MSATALIAGGVDVRTAQTRLGHSSPTVTLGIYARATAEGDRRAAEVIGEALRPGVARRSHGKERPQGSDQEKCADERTRTSTPFGTRT